MSASSETLGTAERELLDAMKRMHESKEYADFVISCGGQEHKVHRAILAARCEYFARMFAFSVGAEAKDRKVTFPDEEADLVAGFIRFLYSADYRILPRNPHPAPDVDPTQMAFKITFLGQNIPPGGRKAHDEKHKISGMAVSVQGKHYWKLLEIIEQKSINQASDTSSQHTFPWFVNEENEIEFDIDVLPLRCHSALIDFLDKLEQDENTFKQSRQEDRMDAPADILYNARMYTMGDKYVFPSLKRAAQEKFFDAASLFYGSKEFVEGIKYVYEMSPNPDLELGKSLAQVIAPHWGWMCGDVKVNEKLKKYPSLAYLVLQELGVRRVA
ncbi:hypothetical protein BCR34DRAFT_660414 [Clohesyomyces aquaticus]|uniref:BTB domain-containing protein n=1 Tax=Clohesyomyces aquaticus TaxID=1231657 RepID=A0A1Y2A6N2_9PLEO|nr:hypothetical protein BCR34DRAFT_660414 [Clohesyomyces aquaticus]